MGKKKISKNQRTNRGQEPRKIVAKIIYPTKSNRGGVSFNSTWCELSDVETELKRVTS